MAHNLTVTGIDHPYWTSHQGNATRIAIWLRRRSYAAPYLREIATAHGKPIEVDLQHAAAVFDVEVAALKAITEVLPANAPESTHVDPENVVRVRKLLRDAEAAHETGLGRLPRECLFGPLSTQYPDELQQFVVSSNGIGAEMSLDGLVKSAPPDLDRRLASLWDQCPDEKKKWADGPIHRQILFALDKLKTDVATEAIGKAIFFAGKGDDVPPAVSRWAAEMYWARKGKDGRAVFEKALDSKVEHVPKVVAKYIGKIGDPALLPKVKPIQCAGAYYSRILLGDETGWNDLLQALAGDRPTEAYLLLVELGAQAEKRALSLLDEKDPRMVVGAAAVLSRVGSDASLAPLEKAAKAHPDVPRLQRALDDLRKLLKK